VADAEGGRGRQVAGGGHPHPPTARGKPATRVLLSAPRRLHHPIDGQEGVKSQFHGAPFYPRNGRRPWRRTGPPRCHESSRRPRQLGGSFAAVGRGRPDRTSRVDPTADSSQIGTGGGKMPAVCRVSDLPAAL